MDLSDALNDWPISGNNQPGGGGPRPGQPANPAWPTNPTWPGGPAGGGGGGPWPGGAGGGGPWPGSAGGGGPWPGGPAGGGPWPGGPAGGGAWPGCPAGGGVPWPGGPAGGGGGGGAWPSGGPSAPGYGPGPAVPSSPQQSLAVPYSQLLPNGVYDKLLITITGVIKPNPDKITVDLSTTSEDVAFHFNPRFNESGRKVIVRNTRLGKKWGKEERELQNFPFVHGQPFEIKIMCTNREFKVAVNNSHLLDFKHRITNLRSINKLCIYNDLNLSRVNVETLP
nr:galectin-3 [Pampus argenteus]